MYDFHRFACGFYFFIDSLMVCAFTAKGNYQRCANIRALAQMAQYICNSFKVKWQLTATLVMEISYCALYLTADCLGHIVGTHYAWDNCHQISYPVFSVRAWVTHKCI
jgi:hypothetical protein